MKFYTTTFAIIALLGNMSLEHIDAKTNTFMTKTDGSIIRRNLVEINDSDSEYSEDSDDSDESQNNLQINDGDQDKGIEELRPYFKGYTPEYNGFDGNTHNGINWRDPYYRKIPDHYADPEVADTFTAKMIRDYAVEGQNKATGKPDGNFWVSKANTKKASYEVLATHLGLKGAAAKEHLKKYFDEVWNHMDVLNKGVLNVVELNHFMRSLCKPVAEHIHLE